MSGNRYSKIEKLRILYVVPLPVYYQGCEPASTDNLIFPPETESKYGKCRPQTCSGAVSVVSIFNTIVLVIHLAYGKPFPDKLSGCELVSENLKISYFVWISSHLCTKVISLATTVVKSDIFLRDRAKIRKVQTSNLFRHRRRCFYPQ